MAKQIASKVKLQIQAGKATPAPPVGTVLGPAGVNLQEFCTKFNDATRDKMGDVVPCEITVYDDRLITTDSNLPNLLLEKRRLQKDELLHADMIIGFMPCDGTQTAIDLAKRNRIDFMIALCEGSCQNDMLAFMDDDWESSMIYEARKAVRDGNLGELKKVKMAKKYQNPYPVIYNQR